VACLWAWYRAVGAPPDVPAIRIVTLANVICVVFITHVYETVYLIQQRESDLVSVARLDRARAEAELSALRSQVDPHFLFNSLNTLSHLIPTDPRAALRFTEGLADIYRYVLSSRHRDLVPLADELHFAEAYVGLLQLRFGDAVSLHSEVADGASALVPAVSLQLLLENAVKHNAFDRASPLDIQVRVEGDHIRVENPRRPRAARERSPETGLQNLDERCRRITGRGIDVRREGPTFSVALPLLRTSA
jgi:LytS/YehU family sensor histidine kinase